MDDFVDFSIVGDGWLDAVIGFVDFSIAAVIFLICCCSNLCILSLIGREVVNVRKLGRVLYI